MAGKLRFPWPNPLVAYAWNAESSSFHVNGCHEYIIVKDVCPVVSVSCIPSMKEMNMATETKLRACPFLVLEDGSGQHCISANGKSSQFTWGDHATVPTKTHLDDDSVIMNCSSAVVTYLSGPSGYHFRHSDLVMSSTMCLPVTLAADDIAFYTKARRGHLAKQLANCRLFLQDYNVVSAYNAQDCCLLKTFTRNKHA